MEDLSSPCPSKQIEYAVMQEYPREKTCRNCPLARSSPRPSPPQPQLSTHIVCKVPVIPKDANPLLLDRGADSDGNVLQLGSGGGEVLNKDYVCEI